jgi:hypothetical protein
MRPYGPKAGRVVPRRPGGVRIASQRDPDAPRMAATAAVVLEVSEDGKLVKCGLVVADRWTGEMRPHGRAALWCPRPRRRALSVGDPVVIYLEGVGDDGVERWRVEA